MMCSLDYAAVSPTNPAWLTVGPVGNTVRAADDKAHEFGTRAQGYGLREIPCRDF